MYENRITETEVFEHLRIARMIISDAKNFPPNVDLSDAERRLEIVMLWQLCKESEANTKHEEFMESKYGKSWWINNNEEEYLHNVLRNAI